MHACARYGRVLHHGTAIAQREVGCVVADFDDAPGLVVEISLWVETSVILDREPLQRCIRLALHHHPERLAWQKAWGQQSHDAVAQRVALRPYELGWQTHHQMHPCRRIAKCLHGLAPCSQHQCIVLGALDPIRVLSCVHFRAALPQRGIAEEVSAPIHLDSLEFSFLSCLLVRQRDCGDNDSGDLKRMTLGWRSQRGCAYFEH